MTNHIITDWGSHDAAVAEILALAQREIRVFDRDLAALKLELGTHHALLREFLSSERNGILTIIVQDATRLLAAHPRLTKLLEHYGHRFTLLRCAESLDGLADSMLLADGAHALVRFHRDNVRARFVTGNPEACAPYLQRFAQILAEGGAAIPPTTLGL